MKPLRRYTPAADPEAGQLPPQAPELEQVVLGAIMLEKGILGQVSDFLEADHFYVPSHGAIYRALTEVSKRGEPIDILTVTQQLKASRELDMAGGAFYIAQLTNKVAGTANIQVHARIILQKFMLRKLIETCSVSLQEAYNETNDVFDLMDAHNEGIASINSITANSDPTNAAEIMARMVDNREQKLYLHFGMGKLDEHVAMGPGCITVIGARPAVGKTTFVLNALMNMARAGHKCLFISLEMNEDQLTAKIASAITGINSERITHNDLNDNERGRIALASAENGMWIPRILIADMASLKASQVAGIMERAVKRHGCKVAVIDYLQLMDGEGDTGVERMSNISKSCKQAAKATGIRLIELSQLKRREGNEVSPQMDDLRESGQIEADGDVIILLGREKGGTEISANVAKNKTGPIGTVRIPFDLMSQRIGGMPAFDPRAGMPSPDNRTEPQRDEDAPF